MPINALNRSFVKKTCKKSNEGVIWCNALFLKSFLYKGCKRERSILIDGLKISVMMQGHKMGK